MPVLSPLFSVGRVCCQRPRRRPRPRGGGLKPTRPTIYGKWTSKSPLRLPGGVCNPLTVLDDHSRYALGLQACADQTGQTVQTQLIQLFTRYGLPYAFLVDNGTPWCGQQPGSLSTLSVAFRLSGADGAPATTATVVSLVLLPLSWPSR